MKVFILSVFAFAAVAHSAVIPVNVWPSLHYYTNLCNISMELLSKLIIQHNTIVQQVPSLVPGISGIPSDNNPMLPLPGQPPIDVEDPADNTENKKWQKRKQQRQ
ncbi:hypothetical protein PVAND_002330 [Polypedilum vanderplanki]|uniref:Uncharacterized protein n=1 Tax=Polypedilum vanderplanki TaxID=319348 RepID=A0A9J6BQN2_POLVA|nr:hypothetical protein PVAND_002330 [Polypedilum vanderplanki]